MIGINYVGHEQGVLSGCHNDVLNMKEYIINVHGFHERNVTFLMDDGRHPMPTYHNLIAAIKSLVAHAKPGDSLFLHYSGHGAKIRDDNSDEADGYDEAMVPCDYEQNGLIRDDMLFEVLVKPMPPEVSLFCLMDCCHSGSILDLPYVFRGDGSSSEMEIPEKFNFKRLLKKFGPIHATKDFLHGLNE